MLVPRGWKRIPLPPDEKWIVAKYLSERKYPSKDGWDHIPEIRVVFFPAGRDLKAKEERKTEKVGENMSVSTTERNYRDYKDYLKENNSGTGFYVSKEEELTINGIPATWMEVKWEKLTTPRRALALVFHRDVGADYAVTFEVLEEQWDKLGRELANAARTFKFVEAKKDLRAAAAAGEGPGPRKEGGPDGPKPPESGAPPEHGEKLTPEEIEKQLEESERKWEEARRRKRAEALQKELDHFRKGMPKGWREVKSRNFVCLTHADEKYTRRVLDQAEGMRAWVDRTFGSLGKNEVSPLLIRICENREEESSFRDTSRGTGFGGFWSGDIDFTTNQEEVGSSLNALGWMNSWVMQNWFSDLDEDVLWSVPTWVRTGLDGVAEGGILSKGRFDFRAESYELVEVRKAVKEGRLLSARDLMRADWEDFSKVEGSWMQCRALVRYLLEGPGAADKRTRGKILEVLRVSGEIRKEKERERRREALSRGSGPEPAAEKKPETEEEEEAMAKRRREENRKEEKAGLEEVLRRAFKDVTDGDWAAIDRQWRAFAAQYE